MSRRLRRRRDKEREQQKLYKQRVDALQERQLLFRTRGHRPAKKFIADEIARNEQWLLMLWPVALFFDASGYNRMRWDKLVEESQAVADLRARKLKVDNCTGLIAGIVLLVSFLLIGFWFCFNNLGHLGPYSFVSGQHPNGHIPLGIVLSVSAIVLAFVPLIFAIRFSDWFAYLGVSDRVQTFFLLGAGVLVSGANVAGHMHRVPPVVATHFALVADVTFAASAILVTLILSFSLLAWLDGMWARIQSWNSPHLQILNDLLRALQWLAPSLPCKSEPFWRVVGTVCSKSSNPCDVRELLRMIDTHIQEDDRKEGNWPEKAGACLQKWFDGKSSDEPLTLKDVALLKAVFKVAAEQSNLPRVICAPMVAFLANLEQDVEDHAWPHPTVLDGLAKCLRSAANSIRVLARRLSSGDPTQDKWLERACKERAAFILELQQWVLMPRQETRLALQAKLCEMVDLTCGGDWGNMERIDLSEIPRIPWWRKVLGAGRTVLIGVVPLGLVLAALSSKMEPYDAFAKPLLPVALLWLAVYLLPVLDSQIGERVSSAKSIANFWKSGNENK